MKGAPRGIESKALSAECDERQIESFIPKSQFRAPYRPVIFSLAVAEDKSPPKNFKVLPKIGF